PDAYPAGARQTKSTGARFPYQQRQRLPQSLQGMDAPLPRRRHEKPLQLPWLASNPGGAGSDGYAGRPDPRGHRTRAISTCNGIIASRDDRQRMDEVLVQHAENDVDRDQRRQDQDRFAGQRGLEGLRVALEARFDRRRQM